LLRETRSFTIAGITERASSLSTKFLPFHQEYSCFSVASKFLKPLC